MELSDFYSDACFEDDLLKALEQDALFPDYSLDFSNSPDENFLYADELLTSELRDSTSKTFFDDYNLDFLEWQNPLDDLNHNTNTVINSEEINEKQNVSIKDIFNANISSLIADETVAVDDACSSVTLNSPNEVPETTISLEATDVHSLLEQFEATASENQTINPECLEVEAISSKNLVDLAVNKEANLGQEVQFISYILDHQYCSTPQAKAEIDEDDKCSKFYNKIPEYIQGLKGPAESQSADDEGASGKRDVSENAEKAAEENASLDSSVVQQKEENDKYSKIPSYLMSIRQRSTNETALPLENQRQNPKPANKSVKKSIELEKSFRSKDIKNNIEETPSSVYSWDQKHYNNSDVSNRSSSYHQQEKSYSVRRNQKLSSNVPKRSSLHARNSEEHKRVPSKIYPPRRPPSLPKPWTMRDDKLNQIEDRRIVYVGNVTEGTTKAELRARFGKFGVIEDVSVHFREHGDNYGFVTFSCKKAAFSAIEHGNDDPTLPKYDLCFGGRRHFCQSSYADLDATANNQSMAAAAAAAAASQMKQQAKRDLDFDSLLNAAKAKIFKR